MMVCLLPGETHGCITHGTHEPRRCHKVCVCVSESLERMCLLYLFYFCKIFFVYVLFQRGREAVDDSTKMWIKAKKRNGMMLATTVVIPVATVVMLEAMMSQETISSLVTFMFSWVTECCNDTEVLM